MAAAFRLLLLAAALAAASPAASPAFAGEVPSLSVIGFAPNGTNFAFEQFDRTADGTVWSEISVLDSLTGQPVLGGPFRSIDGRGDGEQVSVRLMSYAAAGRLLSREAVPGTLVASASGIPGDAAAESARLDLPGMGPVVLKVRGYPVKAPGCEAMGVTARALNIKLFDDHDKELRNILIEKAPPPDRFCPTGYALVQARLFPQGTLPPVLALIVAMNQPAVHGSDRHYIGFIADLAKPPPIGGEEKKEGGEH